MWWSHHTGEDRDYLLSANIVDNMGILWTKWVTKWQPTDRVGIWILNYSVGDLSQVWFENWFQTKNLCLVAANICGRVKHIAAKKILQSSDAMTCANFISSGYKHVCLCHICHGLINAILKYKDSLLRTTE